jgi:hypothetical protein
MVLAQDFRILSRKSAGKPVPPFCIAFGGLLRSSERRFCDGTVFGVLTATVVNQQRWQQECLKFLHDETGKNNSLLMRHNRYTLKN